MNGAETTHAVSSWRRPQGNGSPLSTYGYTARFDGKPYPIPNWGAATVTLKRIDANTIERALDGAEIGKETSTWTLSADRKTLTVTAKGTDATGVAYHEHAGLREAIVKAAGWRIVLLASLGGTLEFYDFVIFGIFARDIADAFFPSGSPLVSLMASFAAFAAGYLARPIGGIVLSHYGDRYGRRAGVPGVGVRDVRGDAWHGPRAVVRAMGRRGRRADGRAADPPGLLPRR